MNVTALRCACHPRVTLPLDHYASGACPDPPFPLEMIEDMLASQTEDDFHAGGRITATRVLGCPRESILLDSKPVALDVRRLNSSHHGTIVHDRLHRRARPGAYSEVRIPPLGVEPPLLFGVPMEGKVDVVRADFSEIVDWKTHGESAQVMKWKRRQSGKPDRELAAQLNIYRLLIARAVLKVPDDEYRPRLVAWHMAQVKAGRGPGEPPPQPRGARGWVPEEPPPGAFRVVLPLMTEMDIASMRPFDDDEAPGTQPYSVAQIVAMLVAYRRAVEGGEAPDAALRRCVPMVGRAVWRGTKCSRYCLALELCDAIEGIRR